MTNASDELEDRLTALLRAQGESVPVTSATWTDVRAAPEGGARPFRRPMLAFGVAALVSLLVAAAVIRLDDGSQQVRTGPAAPDQAQGPTPASAEAPFRVETDQVSLSADALAIDVGGKRFVSAPPLEVRGDPGNPNEYTTLELTWQEHDVEMRLFVYFESDGREWWSNEIRTYDGNANPDWVTYTGEFFRRPLGTPFVGDFTVAAGDRTGRLHVSNLRLQAFRPSPACLTATGPLALDPGTSRVEINHVGERANFSAGYSARVRLLDATSCLPVPDEERYLYEWQAKDPRVVKVTPPAAAPVASEPNRAELEPVAQGRTVVHVTARDAETRAVVAETDIDVVVTDFEPTPPGSDGRRTSVNEEGGAVLAPERPRRP